jgi:putative transposase
LFDHIIAFNERHLYRLIREYLDYYQPDHVLDALAKDAPNRRPVEPKPSAQSTVISTTRAGGLHHRYAWRDAA